MPAAEANGIRLYYELRGEGPPVVLIGGLGSDVSFLRPLLPRLAESFRVLTFDNRGAGRSDKPAAPYSIEQMAEDTVQLVDAVGIERAALVGISMGGSIALALALARPERVSALLLVSASARKPGELHVSPSFRLLGLASHVLPALRGRHPQPREAFERQLAAARSYDCSARLGEIHAPTLVAHGRRDRTVPLDLARELSEGIAGSRLAVFRGGHAFFLFGERRRFLDEAVAFLRAASDAA